MLKRSCLVKLRLESVFGSRVAVFLLQVHLNFLLQVHLNNFRPASNLEFLSKLIGETVFVQLNNYLGENDLHEPLQSAYKIFYSTEAALFTVTNDIMLSFDKGDNVFLVLLDLSAAFDTVNHTLSLVRRQQSFAISLYYNGSSLIFLKELSLLTSTRRILRYEIFPWDFPKVQFYDLYSTFCILRHLQK